MEYFIRADEIGAAQSWRLLAWCAAQGADEFFVRQMSIEGRPEPYLDRVNALLAPYRLPPAVRPRTVVYMGYPDRELTDLWALTPESIQTLEVVLPDGLLAPPSYDEDGWLEEPTVYRGGEIMLGIVSHEGEGFVNLTDAERGAVEALGVRLHPAGLWI